MIVESSGWESVVLAAETTARSGSEPTPQPLSVNGASAAASAAASSAARSASGQAGANRRLLPITS